MTQSKFAENTVILHSFWKGMIYCNPVQVSQVHELRRYWEPVYEDSLNLIARLPEVAAYIYRR